MNLHSLRNAMVMVTLVASLLLVTWPAGAQTQDGEWEWQNPLPQGNNLTAVWGNSGDDVFAVGEHGTILHNGGPLHKNYLPLAVRNCT